MTSWMSSPVRSRKPPSAPRAPKAGPKPVVEAVLHEDLPAAPSSSGAVDAGEGSAEDPGLRKIKARIRKWKHARDVKVCA